MLHHKVIFWDVVLSKWIEYSECRNGIFEVVIFDDIEAAHAVCKIYRANTIAQVVPVSPDWPENLPVWEYRPN